MSKNKARLEVLDGQIKALEAEIQTKNSRSNWISVFVWSVVVVLAVKHQYIASVISGFFAYYIHAKNEESVNILREQLVQLNKEWWVLFDADELPVF